jgi:hypothetical protein
MLQLLPTACSSTSYHDFAAIVLLAQMSAHAEEEQGGGHQFGWKAKEAIIKEEWQQLNLLDIYPMDDGLLL